MHYTAEAGCRPLMKSAARCAWLAAAKIARLSDLENLQPVGDVGGVVLTRLKRQIQIRTEERGAEFGYEFFDRVAFGPEAFGAEGARQARFVRGPVRRLVREGGVVALGVAEGLEGRQHDAV